MPLTSNDKKEMDIHAFLHQAASFVDSNRFISLFNSESFRFDGDASPLFAELRRIFLFQIQQSTRGNFSREYRAKHNDCSTYEVPVEACAKQIASQLRDLAERVKVEGNSKSAKKKFIIPRGTNLMDAAFSHFNASITQDACVILNRLDTPFSGTRTFEERNFLCEMGNFIESLHTLAKPTPYPGYEKVLAKLIVDISYFVEGCPYDILSHDVKSFRQGSNIKAMKVRKDYCSSYVLNEKDSHIEDDNFMIFAV